MMLGRLGASRSAGGPAPRMRGRTPASRIALMKNVAASMPKAAPAPRPTTSAVPSAGPSSSARFSVSAVIARASWISSSGTVWGTSPV